MDLIQFYVDNAAVINLLVGVLFTALLGQFAIKKNIKELHAVVEILDSSLEDDKITLEEQKQIIARVQELVGEELWEMIKKSITR